MFILSFDVGIKNLAFCKLELDSGQLKILQWDIINLSYDYNQDEHLDNLMNNYKTMKINELKQEMIKLDLDVISKKKAELVKSLDEYFFKKKLIKKKLSIFDIGKIMVKKLDQLDLLDNCNIVLIENQPSLKNPIMKSVQMLLFTYFIVRGINDKLIISDLKLISASNKLKKCQKIEKFKDRSNNYKDRKKLSIDYCRYLIDKDKIKLELFNNHSKKDDLADCLLQGIYYLESLKYEFQLMTSKLS